MKIIGKISVWILLCLFSLSNATETIYTASLPTLSKTFDIAENLVQITSSVYFFGFALGILSLGRVSDIFGRRPIVLGGMMLYIVASIFAIFANNIETLIALRFVQAFGASVGSVIGQAMARDSYQGRELSYIYASVSMGLALAPSIGSAIGGYIVEYCGWRYTFVFLSISASILLLSYVKYLPETNPYIGTPNNIGRYFAVVKSAITDKILLLYAFIVGAFNGMAFGFFVEAPFIFIEKIGMKPSQYGKLAFLLSFANAAGSVVSRHWVAKYVNPKVIMVRGLSLSFTGTLLLFIASYYLDTAGKYLAIILVFIPMMLHMVGHSFLIPMALRYALEDYAKVTGTAGSIFGFLYYSFVAIISFTISRIHDKTIVKFSILFFVLSFLCSVSFCLIQKLQKSK